jgi:hypothetical protein
MMRRKAEIHVMLRPWTFLSGALKIKFTMRDKLSTDRSGAAVTQREPAPATADTAGVGAGHQRESFELHRYAVLLS